MQFIGSILSTISFLGGLLAFGMFVYALGEHAYDMWKHRHQPSYRWRR